MNRTGFGFLRLPRTPDKGIDYGILDPLVDRFLALGGTYFDTAYTYLGGLSEEAIRKAVTQRYPRENFILADKLPGYKVETHKQCWDYFTEQQRRCGTDYFDVYLLHWLNGKNYAIAEVCDEFRFLRELKAEGAAREIGFSYHDSPELLERILLEHPEVDIVQLQINYLDWDSVALQSARCYAVAQKYGKKVVVMEPVKGGMLAKLPPEAEKLLRELRPHDSAASWAIRFATELSGVGTVLSGMNAMAQIEDNLRDFAPLSAKERQALTRCVEILRGEKTVQCTGCGYCAAHCPGGIPIPQLFALYNDHKRSPDEGWKMRYAYDDLPVKPDACMGCGVCEKNCPQGLDIRTYLQAVRGVFETS